MRKRSKYLPYRIDRSAWAHCVGMQQQLTDDQGRCAGRDATRAR